MNLLKKFSGKSINPSIEYKGISRYMPIIICGGFFLLTILLFVFGPYDWNISNSTELYIFLFSCFIVLILGYFLGVVVKRKNKILNCDINKIFLISFIIYILTYIMNLYATTGKLYPDIVTGILDSGYAYRISHNNVTTFSTVASYINILIAPLTAFLLPIFFIYFKNLTKTNKILGIIVIILNLFLGIAQGVINSFATFGFQICSILIIYLFSNFNNTTKKEKISIVGIIILIFISFLTYYKVVMSNRLISDMQSNESIKEEINIENELKNEEEIKEIFNSSSQSIAQSKLKDKYFLSFLPDSFEGSVNHLISYITHGYKGLSLAMEKDFTSSYGLGFSDFFRHNFLKVINKSEMEDEIYDRTYMAKLEYDNWSTGLVWSSFFVFPASDIGFTFTIILVFIMGYIFSISWRDTLESKNIFASVIFINMCMMICFFCANNLCFQNGGTFITMCIMFVLWIFSRIFYKES